MASAPYQTQTQLKPKSIFDRWFFTGMALAMIAISLAAFLPGIANSAGRNAPLSLVAAAHGIVFFAWLLLFLVQSRLIATGNRAIHMKLGFAGIALLALMIPLAFATTVAMIRRGFDLSGDLHAATHTANDPAYQAVFAIFNILIFSVLAIGAILFRRRPEIHKRLMLFANMELMPAPLAHLIGHHPWLASLPPAIVMIPISMFVIAAIARDWLVARRIHPLTWTLAILRMVSGGLEAGPIGTSAAWHHFTNWIAQ
jgi:hypothetical protein